MLIISKMLSNSILADMEMLIVNDIISIITEVLIMTILYELCERIAELRNSLGITQAELGKKLGVTRSAVNSWEMGLSIPQLKHVIEMARIFNTTVDSLINSSEQVVVDITVLAPKEQQVIFNMVECLKSYRENKNP